MFTKKEIVSPKLQVKIELEFTNSTLTPQEASERVQFAINGHQERGFSEFIVFMLRNTRSSTWELKNMEIN